MAIYNPYGGGGVAAAPVISSPAPEAAPQVDYRSMVRPGEDPRRIQLDNGRTLAQELQNPSVVPESSAETVAAPAADDEYSLDALLQNNREWAVEQAQRQMDYQTAANKLAMDFSAEQADKARAWEAEMANTAYQRAVQDLKAAGLNPILAYSQGGAAVPSVSAAQGVTSSGALASTPDTGYTKYQLAFQEKQLGVNSALAIADMTFDLIGDILSFRAKKK